MRAGPAATVLGVLLSLALLLPGCGEDGTATAGGATASTQQQSAASSSAAAKSGASVAKPRVSLTTRRCRRSLGEFLDSIESLANTLAVGLNYEDYLASVNRVRATYAAVPAGSLSLPCLGLAAGPAEGALNLYIDAVNTWGNCLATPSCDPESVEPKLQRKWEAAGDLISSAQSGLRESRFELARRISAVSRLLPCLAAVTAVATCWGAPLSGNANGAPAGAQPAVGFQPDPLSIAVDSAGSVYVLNPASGGDVQRYASDGTFVSAWGGSGQGLGELDRPSGIDAGVAGNVYIADTYANRIQEFTPGGDFVRQWTSSRPRDVSTDAAGDVYVVGDSGIQKFTADGSLIGKWGSAASGTGQLGEAWGIAAGPDGAVYVADTYANRIVEFSAAGDLVAEWGSYGSGHGQLRIPYGIATDAAGNVFVADTANNRIQKFTAGGGFVAVWGSAGKRPGHFYTPLAVATDSAGNVYVADEAAPYPFGGASARIQKFSPSGELITQWRSPPLPLLPARPRIFTTLPHRTAKRTVTLHFHSPQDGARFQCRLSGERVPAKLSDSWHGCVSPKRYRRLRPGRKVFSVRAVRNGRASRPVSRTWRVVTRGQ